MTPLARFAYLRELMHPLAPLTSSSSLQLPMWHAESVITLQSYLSLPVARARNFLMTPLARSKRLH